MKNSILVGITKGAGRRETYTQSTFCNQEEGRERTLKNVSRSKSNMRIKSIQRDVGTHLI